MTAGSGVLEARPVLGVSAMMLNTVLIPLMGVAIKKLTAMDVSTIEMLAYRSVLVVAVLTPFLLFRSNRRAIPVTAARATSSSTSSSSAVHPCAAATWAMPAPMVPAPRTPTRVSASSVVMAYFPR